MAYASPARAATRVARPCARPAANAWRLAWKPVAPAACAWADPGLLLLLKAAQLAGDLRPENQQLRDHDDPRADRRGDFFRPPLLTRRARASLSGTPEMRSSPSMGDPARRSGTWRRRPTAQMTSTTAAVALRASSRSRPARSSPEDQDHQKREWNGTGLAGERTAGESRPTESRGRTCGRVAPAGSRCPLAAEKCARKRPPCPRASPGVKSAAWPPSSGQKRSYMAAISRSRWRVSCVSGPYRVRKRSRS